MLKNVNQEHQKLYLKIYSRVKENRTGNGVYVFLRLITNGKFVMMALMRLYPGDY